VKSKLLEISHFFCTMDVVFVNQCRRGNFFFLVVGQPLVSLEKKLVENLNFTISFVLGWSAVVIVIENIFLDNIALKSIKYCYWNILVEHILASESIRC
jgi:hypothetical protein